MNTRRLRAGIAWILLVVASAMLSGCDGGIFGTGDGGIDTPADIVDAGSPGSEPPAVTESPDDVDPLSPGAQPGDPDNASQVELRPFENLLIGSDSTQPLIALVNFSTRALNATAGADPLFATAIQPDGISDYAGIALGSTQLSVFAAATDDPLLILTPLNLAAFSVSTLIARDRLTTDASEQTNPDTRLDVEIIAVATQRLPSDDGVARVRLLQVGPLDDNDRPASMRLVPADATPGGSETDLGIVSAAALGTSADYRLVAPGSYRLVDSLGRLAPIAIELSGGEFHTLILSGSPATLRVLRDSQAAQ